MLAVAVRTGGALAKTDSIHEHADQMSDVRLRCAFLFGRERDCGRDADQIVEADIGPDSSGFLRPLQETGTFLGGCETSGRSNLQDRSERCCETPVKIRILNEFFEIGAQGIQGAEIGFSRVARLRKRQEAGAVCRGQKVFACREAAIERADSNPGALCDVIQ